jgi:hypothetical protein
MAEFKGAVRGGENSGHYKTCPKSHEAKWPLDSEVEATKDRA